MRLNQLGKASGSLQGRQAAVGLDKGLLRRVLRQLKVAQQGIGIAIGHVLKAGHQRAVCRRVSFLGAHHRPSLVLVGYGILFYYRVPIRGLKVYRIMLDRSSLQADRNRAASAACRSAKEG